MRIAIIEDNTGVANGIAYRLQDHGHATDIIGNGLEADAFLRGDGNDLVVLDINLPGLDGLSVLRNLRARGDTRPVLLLTANDQTAERVAGLDAGADDYLTKPFAMEELEARLRALARRPAQVLQTELRFGALCFAVDTRVVTMDEAELDLPRREASALEVLLRAKGRTVTKEALLSQIYGTGADIDGTAVEVHLSRLRKRLRPYGIEILVQRGLGYRLAHAGGAL